MDGVEFAFSLIDKASGPAEKIAEGLGGASEALHKMDEAAGKTSKLTKAVNILTIGLRALQIAAAGVELFKAFGGTTDQIKKWFSSMKAGLASFGASAGAAAKKAAPFVAAGGGVALIGKGLMMATPPAIGLSLGLAAVGVAALAATAAITALGVKAAFALGKAVAGAFVLREQAQLSFEALRHAGGTGEDQFNRVKEVARQMGTDLGQTVHQFQKLAAAQFSMEDSIAIFKRMQDLLKATGASAEVADRAILSITQIKAKGKLQAEELMQLNEAGLSMELVFKALAKNTGKSMAEVQKAITAGKIDSVTGIKAIQDAIGLKTGGKPPGAKAIEIMNNTLSVTIERAKNLGGILLDDIAQKAGPAIKDLKPILDEVMDALTGEGAKGVISELGDAFTLLAQGAKAAWPFVKQILAGFAEGFGEGWNQLKQAGKTIQEAFGGDSKATLDEWAPTLRQIGAGFGQVAIVLLAVTGAVLGFVGAVVGGGVAALAWLQALPERIGAFVADVQASALELGTAIINGIVTGLQFGAALVTDAIRGVAQGAINSAKAALGIHSPSAEFAWLGQMSALGMAQGVNDNAFAPQQAMNEMVAAPSASVSARGVGGGITIHLEQHFHITGGADPGTIREAAERGAREGLEAVLEQIAREVAA